MFALGQRKDMLMCGTEESMGVEACNFGGHLKIFTFKGLNFFCERGNNDIYIEGKASSRNGSPKRE